MPKKAVKKTQTALAKREANSKAQKLPLKQAKNPRVGRNGQEPPVANRWKPGQSGNPKGRGKSAGALINDWLRIMANWRTERLESVVRARNVRAPKKAAARWLLDASTEDRNKVGNPIAGPELDRLLDRTLGKATARVELTGKDGKPVGIEQNTTLDYSRLDKAELETLERLMAKLVTAPAANPALPGPVAEIITGEVVEKDE